MNFKWTDPSGVEHEIEVPKDIKDSIDNLAFQRGKTNSEKKFKQAFADMVPEDAAGLAGKDLTEAIKTGMASALAEVQKTAQGQVKQVEQSNELDLKTQVAKMVAENNQKMQEQMDKNNLNAYKEKISAFAIQEKLKEEEQKIFPSYVDQYFDFKSVDGKTTIHNKEGDVWINEKNQIGTQKDVAKFIKEKHSGIFETIKTGAGANLNGTGIKPDNKVDLTQSSSWLISAGIDEIPEVENHSREL